MAAMPSEGLKANRNDIYTQDVGFFGPQNDRIQHRHTGQTSKPLCKLNSIVGRQGWLSNTDCATTGFCKPSYEPTPSTPEQRIDLV